MKEESLTPSACPDCGSTNGAYVRIIGVGVVDKKYYYVISSDNGVTERKEITESAVRFAEIALASKLMLYMNTNTKEFHINYDVPKQISPND